MKIIFNKQADNHLYHLIKHDQVMVYSNCYHQHGISSQRGFEIFVCDKITSIVINDIIHQQYINILLRTSVIFSQLKQTFCCFITSERSFRRIFPVLLKMNHLITVREEHQRRGSTMYHIFDQ